MPVLLRDREHRKRGAILFDVRGVVDGLFPRHLNDIHMGHEEEEMALGESVRSEG